MRMIFLQRFVAWIILASLLGSGIFRTSHNSILVMGAYGASTNNIHLIDYDMPFLLIIDFSLLF